MTGCEPWRLRESTFWCADGVDKEVENVLRFLGPRSAEGVAEGKSSSASLASSFRLRFAADREVQ